MKPLALDLFCSEGLAARGILAAGFDVIGVDIRPSVAKWFPAASRIHIGDWRKTTDKLRRDGVRPDLVWASPPCQRYSQGTVAGHAHKHPDLIGQVRDYLDEWGVPYVIENVPRSPLMGAVELCGTMFGLEADDPASGRRLYLKRHRLFEASGFTMEPSGEGRMTDEWEGPLSPPRPEAFTDPPFDSNAQRRRNRELIHANRLLREEVDRLRKILHDDEAHDDAIGAVARVRALIDPASEMATTCWPRVRHFDASDIARALDGTA